MRPAIEPIDAGEQAAALLDLLGEFDGIGMARAAKRLRLGQSQLRRLLSALGDHPVAGGPGWIEIRSAGDRETLHLTATGRAALQVPAPLRRVPASRYEDDRAEVVEDIVAEETPVALVYNGVGHAVMMATPADLDDFALGFSLTEGIVADAGELEIVETRAAAEGISIQMAIPAGRFEALRTRSRNLAGRVGCGLCGADTLAAAIRPVPRVESTAGIDPAAIETALAALQPAQVMNTQSHGLHAAAFANADGAVAVVREDVGRHNALDKVVGALARGGASTRSGFVVVTSRASYEVVHKAASAGVGLVVAVSAPTALAIALARRANVALVAFARGRTMTVYADRLPAPSPAAA